MDQNNICKFVEVEVDDISHEKLCKSRCTDCLSL